MGQYLDMARSTKTIPNETIPEKYFSFSRSGFSCSIRMERLHRLDPQGNYNDTSRQENINEFSKVFMGWTFL